MVTGVGIWSVFYVPGTVLGAGGIKTTQTHGTRSVSSRAEFGKGKCLGPEDEKLRVPDPVCHFFCYNHLYQTPGKRVNDLAFASYMVPIALIGLN